MHLEKTYQRKNKRLENAQKAYGKLEALLSDYDHKNLVLAWTYDEDVYCHFSYKPSDTILGGLIRAPSSATKSSLLSTVSRASLVVDKIHAYGFVAGAPNFLRGLVVHGRQEHYIKFVARYLQQLSTAEQEAILNPQSRYVDLDEFVRLIECGKPFDALLNVLIRAAEDDRQCPEGLHPMIFYRRIRARGESQRPSSFHLPRKSGAQRFVVAAAQCQV
jgi:hypothetical protein